MEQHFNGLSPETDELLSKVTEECAEVIHIIQKIQQHGFESMNPHDVTELTNKEMLQKELGDLKAVVNILVNKRVVFMDAILEASHEKLERIGKYMHHYKGDPRDVEIVV